MSEKARHEGRMEGFFMGCAAGAAIALALAWWALL